MRGRTVSPWLVRRKPGNKKIFQVVSFESGYPLKETVAKEFYKLEDAQDFCNIANLMIGRNENPTL